MQEHTHKLKCNRVNTWKIRIKHAAHTGGSYIFRYLQQRLQNEPPNLVQDELGNILYQPDKALDCLNSKWDSVYGVNASHEDPIKILQTIWPYVGNHVHAASLPPLTRNPFFGSST